MATRYSVEGKVARGMVVRPSPPENGGIKQPAYTRGKNNDTKSRKVKKVRSYIAECMSGKEGSRADIRNEFGECARQAKQNL